MEYGKAHASSLDEKVDATLDNLLVQFGKEILKIVPGKVSTEVDARFSFDTAKSVEKALHIIDVSPLRWTIYTYYRAMYPRLEIFWTVLNHTLVDSAGTDRNLLLAIQRTRHLKGSDPHQGSVDVGGHQGGADLAVQARDQLQLDAHVLARAGRCCRRGGCFPHLTIRRTHSGLVQGCREEGLCAAGRPWREERMRDFQLLQEAQLQDHRHGCVV